MNDAHTVTYSARALRTPLAALVAVLDAEHAQLEPKLADAAALAKGRKSLAPFTDSDIEAQNVLQRARTNRRDREKAALWLQEVRRLWPWVRFRLTIDEVAWLYRGRGVG